MSKPINSLESLIDWLKTKDPNETYSYYDGRSCALYQYFKFKGCDVISVDGHNWWDSENKRHPFPDSFVRVPMPNNWVFPVLMAPKMTFGLALKNAEEALVEEKANG